MLYNYIGTNPDELLPQLLDDILTEGDEIGSRAGRVKELMHVGITMDKPWQREILTPGRKPSIAAQIAETVWILSGRDDVEWLRHYLPRAAEFSDDGKVWRGGYGPRLRAWPKQDGDVLDQLAYVVDLLRESPATRRAVAMIYDPARDSGDGKDIPCNNWLSFSSRLGQLDLHVAVRSNDVMWGWSGINTFEWSALLEIMAGMLGLGVGGLHFSTTSFHLYDRHWGQAQNIVQHSRDTVMKMERPADSPRFDAKSFGSTVDGLDELLAEWTLIEAGIRNGNAMIHEVDRFPEPMLRSWLRVLQWWWSGDRTWLAPLAGTALEAATFASVQPKLGYENPAPKPTAVSYVDSVIALHNEKHAAYGDSWCRRGEMLGILANIARKVDRLEGGMDTPDETRADTASDLFVYLAKYAAWIRTDGENNPDLANKIMREVASGQYREWQGLHDTFLVHALTAGLQHLEDAAVTRDLQMRTLILNGMLCDAFVLADRWAA
jgi:thymidylate synthase